MTGNPNLDPDYCPGCGMYGARECDPEPEFDCGQLPDGTCMYAGTEDCDWECPYGD